MTTDTVFPSLDKTQPLDVNLQHLRDQPRTAIEAFGDEWAANCAGSALTEIARLQAQVDALADALVSAESALSDIGDADREPGDDLHWCENRAAEALPAVRAALAAIGALT